MLGVGGDRFLVVERGDTCYRTGKPTLFVGLWGRSLLVVVVGRYVLSHR
ncbi:MAG: hypothetical protein F6K30_03050 [Cyanothece sp. SIO2G6]|nr:hypothetical protein [Cyanothece sp. SIO2G6]